jgi:sec-independent protein translocase protein TatB
MGFGELAVVVIVALVVFGPKELPKMLRKLGQWAGKLRRMAADLRAQSGIDEALRSEGLAEPLREIQKLTRGELDGVMRAASLTAPLASSAPGPAPVAAPPEARPPGGEEIFPILREREYPMEGADHYGCLPDTAIVYEETLPRSPLAQDPLYVLGDASARVPAPVAKETAAEEDADLEHEADGGEKASEGDGDHDADESDDEANEDGDEEVEDAAPAVAPGSSSR